MTETSTSDPLLYPLGVRDGRHLGGVVDLKTSLVRGKEEKILPSPFSWYRERRIRLRSEKTSKIKLQKDKKTKTFDHHLTVPVTDKSEENSGLLLETRRTDGETLHPPKPEITGVEKTESRVSLR